MSTKTIKVVTLDATFMELPVPKARQSGRGEGSNLRAAAAAAMRNLLKSPAIRGRRITAAKIVMSVGFRVVEEEETNAS